MRVNREELLRSLSLVGPGLATREVVEQSASFCFTGGKVMTFNDEIACSVACPLAIEGAVAAAPMVALLSKLTEAEVDINIKGEQLIVAGTGKRSGLPMQAQVVLPIDTVDAPEEDGWAALDGGFCEAMDLVVQCVSGSDERFDLTCVHIQPDYVEACDSYQFSRYPIATGVSEACLVRGKSVKNIVGLGMNAIAETASWLHFRNASGLVMSCRKWAEAYPDFTCLMDWEGVQTVLPGGLAEMAAKAEIFSSDNFEGNHVQISLLPNQLRIKGKGPTGWYEERCPIKYDGTPLEFLIAPKLLASLTGKSQECEVTEGKLRINTGKATYIACLLVAEDALAVA